MTNGTFVVYGQKALISVNLAIKVAQDRVSGLTKVSPVEETSVASKMWSDHGWQDAEEPGQGRRTQLLGEFLNEF